MTPVVSAGLALTLALLQAGVRAPGVPATARPAPAPVPWTAEQRATAVDGCRNSILLNATRDYLQRNGLREDQLPADFAARAVPAMEPYLAICDCMIDAVAADTSLADFNASAESMAARIQALAADGGRCATGGSG
ncbi:MAG TPA: hypothetical protein VLK29_10415 [Luteimonas sp.]|nr:hypothetical protein [Luteimonas sp.]